MLAPLAVKPVPALVGVRADRCAQRAEVRPAIRVRDDNLPIAEQQPSGVRRYHAAVQSCFRRAAIDYFQNQSIPRYNLPALGLRLNRSKVVMAQ
jgi:hypothetical protein